MVDIASAGAEVLKDVAGAGAQLVDRLTPDVKVEIANKQGAQRAALDAEIAAGAAQADITKIESQNPSKFIGGWRPALGWICNACIGLYYIPQFVLIAIMQAVMFYQSCKSGHCAIPPRPDISLTEILGLVGSLLGNGALRTVDKFLGVDTRSLSQATQAIRTITTEVSRPLIKAAAGAARALPLLIVAGALASCQLPNPDLMPAQAAPVVVHEREIPFTCTNAGQTLEMKITVDGDDMAAHVQAYLDDMSDAAAAALVGWVRANDPDSLDSARQIVSEVNEYCRA